MKQPIKDKEEVKWQLILTLPAIILLSVLFYTLPSDCSQKRPPVTERQVMIASAHPLASKVGLEILKKGGNAVDAAVAAAFALGVVEPFASGIGGGGFVLIYLARSNEVITIDYREMAPLKANLKMYQTPDGQLIPDRMKEGHSAVAIPATLAGLSLALSKYGTMDLKNVMEPAIEIAEKGYEVSRLLNTMMADNAQKLIQFPAAARIYLKGGRPLEVGDRLFLKDLAKTYRLIAERGPDVFYKGTIADAIEREMKSGKGIITKEDLSAYKPVFRTPVKGTYRGYEIFSMGPSSSGGTHVIELLNILEGYDIAHLGHNSSESIRIMAEAMKKVFSDRERFMGDPDFVRIPLNNLISKEHAEKLRMEIGTRKGSAEVVSKDPAPDTSHQTTHLSVVDSEGNLVALTQTINSFFGSGVVVPETGVLLNDEMNDFTPQKDSPNSIEPRKRPVSNMSPTLVLKGGRPFLTIGMPGGTRIISVLPQILMNMIDYKMNLQEAINAPRIHCMDGEEIFMESRIPKEVQDDLVRRGYRVTVKKDFDLYFGGTQGVVTDPNTGMLHGGADPRREGSVMGSRVAHVSTRAVGGRVARQGVAVLTIVIVIGVILVIAIAASIFFQKRQTERLRSQFGAAEYARTMKEMGNRRGAEAELKKRKERVKAFHIRPLAPDDRDRFKESWRRVQGRFVDDPGDALTEADRLIGDVMSKLGYPPTDFEQRVADISVNHPLAIENYRSAHQIMVRQTQKKTTTEELRQAMIHYRTLFGDLLGEPELSRGKGML